MKNIYLIMLIFIMIFSVTACSDSNNGNDNGQNLVAEKNAIEAGVNVRNLSPEAVKFLIDPSGHENPFIDEGLSPYGTYGTCGLVPAKIKGEKADVDGSFTLYANDKSGPFVTIHVKGSYGIDELRSYDNNYFFHYKDGQFIQLTKEDWTNFKKDK
ncbi:MAG: hypothetical protein VR72_09255 [Clostridiaceae bacterium BRH_c20a]|nr:MAG: hypothetical protein VR72_09255 [Clostridiaceae bacterium BRH_c20a]